MVKEKENLVIPEKQKDQFDYASALKQLAEAKKAELEDINHKILVSSSRVTSLEESCKRIKADFDQRMAKEEQEYKNKRDLMLNELATRFDKLEKGERNQNEREIMLKEKEKEAAILDEQKRQMYKDRIELDKLTNNAKIEYTKTMSMQSDLQNKINQASSKEIQANEKLSQSVNLEQSAQQKLNSALEKEKDIKVQIENLERIRVEIEPRIKEYTEKEENIKKQLSELQLKENIINSKIEENKNLLQSMSQRDTLLKSKEIDIASREEEVMRKEMMLDKK